MRTTVDIDDAACAAVMIRFGLSNRRDAINVALNQVAAAPYGAAELELQVVRRLTAEGWSVEDVRQALLARQELIAEGYDPDDLALAETTGADLAERAGGRKLLLEELAEEYDAEGKTGLARKVRAALATTAEAD